MVPHTVLSGSFPKAICILSLLRWEIPDGPLARVSLPQPSTAAPARPSFPCGHTAWGSFPAQPSVMTLSELSRGPFHPRASERHLLHQISPSLHFYQFMFPPPILKSLALCSPLPAILLTHGTPNPNHCLRCPLSPEHSAWARGSLAYWARNLWRHLGCIDFIPLPLK